METAKQKLVNQIFQDVALMLGGVVALRRREISDKVIWEIAKDLKRLHSQYLPKAKKKDHGVDLKPHPAIEDLIRKIRLSQRQDRR